MTAGAAAEATATTTPNTNEQYNVPVNDHERLKHNKPNWLPKNQYNRQKKKLLKQKINVVFNNSSLVLSEGMLKVLNRGLKFAVLPVKLDITQILTDFRRFERTVVWKEFWFGNENTESYDPPMFRKKKHNFPRNHKPPKGVQDFLAAVKSDLMDPNNRNKINSNITDEEKEALKMLIKLQKEKRIVVKPCDKGAGIIILDYKEYVRACR